MHLQLCEIVSLLAGAGEVILFFLLGEMVLFLFFYWVRWCAEVIWYCKRCSAKSEDSQEGREELVGGSRLSLISSHHFHTWLFPMGGFFHRYFQQGKISIKMLGHCFAINVSRNELATFTAKYFCARQNNPVTQKLSKSNFYQDESKFQQPEEVFILGLVHRSVRNVCNQ